MKYYISEYWAMVNSTDANLREEGKTKWDESAKKYGPYFESIKNMLPKNFIEEFNKNNWFHDFQFNSMHVFNLGEQITNVELYISHNSISYKIILSGVKGVSFNIPTTQSWLFGKLTWGYTEFELNDDKIWIIRILCDIECEIEVLFETINILDLSK